MTPSGICVVWSCPECGASGTIDPVNPPEVAISALLETHRLLSPQCVLALDDDGEAKELAAACGGLLEVSGGCA